VKRRSVRLHGRAYPKLLDQPVRVIGRVLVFVTFCALPLAQGCAGGMGHDQDVQVTDSAGVRVLRNLAGPPDTVAFDTPDIRIGGINMEPEYSFQSIRDLTVLPDGTIVVADLGGRLAQFSPTGHWKGDIGRTGEGPGEYGQPIFVHTRADTLVLWDARPPRLSLFAAAGEFLRVVPFEKTSPGLPLRWLADDVVIDEREWGQTYDPSPARATILRVRGREVIDTIKGPYSVPEFEWKVIDPKDQTGAMVMPPAFSVRPQWEVCGSDFYWVNPSEPRLQQLAFDGTLLVIIEVPSRSRLINDADRNAYLGAIADRFDLDEAEVKRLRAETKYRLESPEITDVLCGNRGQVWIADFSARVPEPLDAVGPEWDVIGDDGRILTRIQFPQGFVLKAVAPSAAYGYAARELGVHVVEVYYLPVTTREASGVQPN
jgi:hypothetical protein